MAPRRMMIGIAFGIAMVLPARAQQLFDFDLSGVDAGSIALLAEDVVMRAPDRDLDRLFDAMHRASQSDADAAVVCALLAPDADRSAAALQRAAGRLSAANRQGMLDALAMLLLSGMQQPRQPYDAASAAQVVRSAGVKAMFLNEGFAEGISADGSGEASGDLRCRSLRWLVDALADFEPGERAAAMRYLLLEGVALARPSSAASSSAPRGEQVAMEEIDFAREEFPARAPRAEAAVGRG